MPSGTSGAVQYERPAWQCGSGSLPKEMSYKYQRVRFCLHKTDAFLLGELCSLASPPRFQRGQQVLGWGQGLEPRWSSQRPWCSLSSTQADGCNDLSYIKSPSHIQKELEGNLAPFSVRSWAISPLYLSDIIR